jgi:hypothetical protein
MAVWPSTVSAGLLGPDSREKARCAHRLYWRRKNCCFLWAYPHHAGSHSSSTSSHPSTSQKPCCPRCHTSNRARKQSCMFRICLLRIWAEFLCQAREMEEFGLSSISLSAKTLTDASNEGRDLYNEIRRGQWSIIFVSAERLISREFDHLIRDV